MKLVSIAEGKAKLSGYVDECRRQAIVLTKHGRPRAALVPLDDEDDLERFLLARNPQFQELLARSARSSKVPLDDAKAKSLSKSRNSTAGKIKRSRALEPGKRRRPA